MTSRNIGENKEREFLMNSLDSTETNGQETAEDDFLYELLAEMRLP